MLAENYWRAMPQAHALFMVKLGATPYWEGSFCYTVLFVAWLPQLILLGSSEMMWDQRIVRSGWRVLLILYYMWSVMNKIAFSYRCPSSFFVVSRYFLGLFAKLWKAIISFVMSVRPSAWNNSAPTGRIFVKFDSSVFLSLSRKFEFH